MILLDQLYNALWTLYQLPSWALFCIKVGRLQVSMHSVCRFVCFFCTNMNINSCRASCRSVHTVGGFLIFLSGHDPGNGPRSTYSNLTTWNSHAECFLWSSLVPNLFFHTAPSAPIDLIFTNFHTVGNYSNLTASIVLPSGLSETFRPEYYEVSIRPEPLAQPVTERFPSSFELQLDIDTVYTYTITSVRCGERNSSFVKTLQIRT